MLEITASGPIEQTEEYRNQGEDGRDPYQGSATLTRRPHLRCTLELPNGHVNLEGFAPSSYGGTDPGWSLSRIARCSGHDLAESEADAVADQWTVTIRGEWWDWLDAAHRYGDERPGETAYDHLTRFSRWDETETRTFESDTRRRSTPLDTARDLALFADVCRRGDEREHVRSWADTRETPEGFEEWRESGRETEQ